MTVPDAAEPPPAVEAAQLRVLAAVARSAANSSLRPPALLAARPMRPLPAPLAAKLAARSAAGLDPAGTDRPRGRRRRFARDPLRLSRAERRTTQNSRSWASRQPWIDGRSASRERALVTVAADTVARICATAAWESPHLDGHRHRLDLAAELDQIDAQAFSLAAAPQPDARVEQMWLAIVDRVAALDIYADHLAALDRRLTALDHALRGDTQAAELSVGALRDAHAGDAIGALVEELAGLAAAVTEVDHAHQRPAS